MSVATPDGVHERYVHEAVYYDSSDQLVAATAPVLQEALVKGEHVALVCSEANNRALMKALGEDDRVSVLPRPEIYTKAVTAVAYFRDFVQEQLEEGAPRVCVLGEVGFGRSGRGLDEWRRYEALLNHALGEFPLWSICGYDTSFLPDPVIATGELTHPYLRRGGVQAPNPVPVDPAQLLRLADADTTPLGGTEPAVTIPELVELRELHRELQAFLAGVGTPPDRVDDVLTAVHEVAINGLRHGEPPVTVQFWAAPGRVDFTVTDRGPGFDDPFSGYVRGGGDALPEGHFGLWLARQLCDEVLTRRTTEGFTTRLVVHL